MFVDEGKFLGSISRNTLINDAAKSVVLVNHNEYSQAVKGIESANIVEIIDHHHLGAMTTLQPISFDLEPVGSTSTIITKRFKDATSCRIKALQAFYFLVFFLTRSG